MQKKHAISLIVVGSITTFLLLFYLTCLHHTESTELGIMRNWITGEMQADTPGWHLTSPWVRVAKIDLRPNRVCISSAGKARSCKLVQFDREFWKEFVDTEGFGYWWWSNRFSFNSGYDEEYRGFRDILRGYAYSSTRYNFVKVLND